jgi:hypothetical protein
LYALTIWIVLYARRMGMNYGYWLIGYLVLATIELSSRLFLANNAITWLIDGICIAYILTFTFWPLLVSDEKLRELNKQAKANEKFESEHAERFYESISEWVTVKSYIDSNQVYELHNDRDILNANSIPSFVKTAGITTLAVHEDNFVKASELLGIVPLDYENA